MTTVYAGDSNQIWKTNQIMKVGQWATLVRINQELLDLDIMEKPSFKPGSEAKKFIHIVGGGGEKKMPC